MSIEHVLSYFVLFLTLIVLLLIAVFIVKATQSVYHALRPRTEQEKQSAATKATPAALQIYWMLVVVGVMVGGISTYLIAGRKPGAPAISIWLFLLVPVGIFAAVVLLLATYVVILSLRNRDSLSIRAVKRFREGDLDGAIREMSEGIEIAGVTADRLNHLGVLYNEKKAHAEALRAFTEAADLGGPNLHIHRANQALALRELGRPEEALPLIEEARKGMPTESVIACHHCMTLADLGRFDEARMQLHSIESMPRVLVFPKSAREARAKLLKECQDRLAAKPVASERDFGDEL